MKSLKFLPVFLHLLLQLILYSDHGRSRNQSEWPDSSKLKSTQTPVELLLYSKCHGTKLAGIEERFYGTSLFEQTCGQDKIHEIR
jgi:hypothetical protein